jgi:peptide/nickel transport system substrate-binding protein/oligopeptide transport system substrate-binding protein
MYQGEPYTNPDFRKAVSLAVDVEAIIEQVLSGQGQAATSWVPEGAVLGGQNGTCEFCRYEPEEAKALLDAAGGWPEGEVMTIHFGADPTSEAIFKAIGDQINLNLGIEYTLDPTEDFFSRRGAQDFDGPFRNNWFADYPLNQNYLGPVGYAAGSAEDSQFGWYNEAFEAKLAEDFPTVPLLYSNNYTFYSENVDNVQLDPFSGSVELRSVQYVGE